MTVFRSSGNLQADRRYEYARAALEECDGQAAADLFRQTLELVPDWPPAHFGLGEALALEGAGDQAAAAFRRTLELAPDDALGAALRLAKLGALPVNDAMRPGYVAALFDDYADRFEDHLVNALRYRAPEIIVAALRTVCAGRGRPFRFSAALDLGCGTGLMARALVDATDCIDGVDLSPRMVAKARATGLYRDVRVADAVDALASSYPLLLAADVIVYINDVTRLLQAARQALEPEGFFAFTFQLSEAAGHDVGPDLRHHHSEAYMRDAALAAGLTVVHAEPCVPRFDAGEPVPGMVMVLADDGG
ncbi:MAG: methyltransferase [Beijerinckiaceae bacterium]